MDINTPIEITENSTGQDMLNEVRRAFSIYLYKEIQKIASIPVYDNKQARMLSQHLSQRLGTMRMLMIIDDKEMIQATTQIRKLLSPPFEPTVLIFAPITQSPYSEYTVDKIKTMWNSLLQEFFIHCLTSGAKQICSEEQKRMYAFAENAIQCWYDLGMMNINELQKACEIIKSFRLGNTNINTEYTSISDD